jgi:hypothetical protein
MYAGHIAAGLALKTVVPKAPSWALIVGVGLLDILFGPFVLVGIEHARGRLIIPWSHSLLMAVIWGGLFAMPFYRAGVSVVAVLWIAVLSHWVLDACVHQKDMQLWPGWGPSIGFGALLGGNAGWFETLITIAAVFVYAMRARRASAYGRRWPAAVAVVAICYAMEIVGG